MIINNEPRSSWRIRHNHQLHDHTVTWDTDTIPMKDRDRGTLSSVEIMVAVYMSANESQTLRDEYS
jgi:hypothetical protein